MLRKWFKKYWPQREYIIGHRSMKVLRRYLSDAVIWQFNRESVSRGAAIGLFAAFIPLPFQMLIAGFFSILFKANLPVAVASTWVSNPVTFVPLNYLIYWVGAKVLAGSVAKAYFVGLPILAIGTACAGYFIVQTIWLLRDSLVKKFKKRKGK